MFKKLKDKLAEEVKSSPQRIQQFAQAAQAAVTSASSSISDITNSDLFSIGDNESQSNQAVKPSISNRQHHTFQDVSLTQTSGTQAGSDSTGFLPNSEIMENQRQRRLSNSSFTSDVSFRLPSYESPSMYHLQSDMEVSASEAEERGFSSGAVSLERVTKEQLYAAYRRTQERYTKYRTQYADLARHYKLLERENAKARSVLVETQDKALRRISELREQCTLEQSAKAHLEKALRVEIEERNMKIEALNTKISFLQNVSDNDTQDNANMLVEAFSNSKGNTVDNDVQLINLLNENEETQPVNNEASLNENAALTGKIEKMEQLLYKYKESLKNSKEKNSQMTTELQILTTELENKIKENNQLKATEVHLSKSEQKIQELNIIIEELQNKVNTYDFTKTKEMSTLETDLQKSHDEIARLRSKIDVFSKREEDYAISLAENKLSIHKELESKETEIKSLKDNLSIAKKELQSLNTIVNDYNTSLAALEEERFKLNNDINEFNSFKVKIGESESQINVLTQKYQALEQSKTKTDEEIKCLQLQMKQETAEKLAMIDRNGYLENRNAQLAEENTKKSAQITQLEVGLNLLKEENANMLDNETKKQLLDEIEFWKAKFSKLQSEIQDEREELVKLQSEIEKLLTNHDLVRKQNSELQSVVSALKSENAFIQERTTRNAAVYETMAEEVKDLQKIFSLISEETIIYRNEINDKILPEIKEKIYALSGFSNEFITIKTEYENLKRNHQTLQNESRNCMEQLQLNLKELTILKDENNNLISQIQDVTSENHSLQEELQNITSKYGQTSEELNAVKKEKQILIVKLEELEGKYLHLQTTIDHENNQYLVALDKLKLLQDEKQTLLKKIYKIEKENDLVNNEIEKLKIKQKDDIFQINTLKSEKEQLLQKVEEKGQLAHKLDQRIQILSQEKIELNNKCDSIANSVKFLESEINEVRKSHTEMEIEKDRLSNIIETLEKNEHEKNIMSIEKNIQTEINVHSNLSSEDIKDDFNENEKIISLLSDIDQLNAKNCKYEKEITSLNETRMHLLNQISEINATVAKNNAANFDNFQALQNEHDLLKDENRRLQSDIEGLQTYLAKISKENGILNDKLRELIASSENTARTNYQSNEFLELQNEVIADKEKIEDLTRENSLLLEENLELKDQLVSQNYAETKKSSNNNEGDVVTIDKYNDLLGTKNKLEENLTDLEQINTSINGNMQRMQSNNEKLRLTNEKLERRLDEALVSLRHLHALQENTELEYLKNILYEYLTGPGNHSITLAKVLAAVVKFDDKQTQHVLQKEKERQGLLRQLGFI